MTENGIRDSLSRLKASPHYARTLLEVQRQIEAEAEAARLEAERLERDRLAVARPFPPPPLGGASAAEIVQILHIWPTKLYKPRLKILVHAGLLKTERAEGRMFADNV